MKQRNNSKFLSLVLRHEPKLADLVLDKEGYALVADVCKNLPISMEELEDLVETNDKKRFAFNSDKTKIRASQGHSLSGVQITMEPLKDVPEILYHGTKESILKNILKEGLSKMSRNHVHLSSNEDTAKKVADRRNGKSVILKVSARAMRADGFKFYLSENSVYLTDSVPAKYILNGLN